jgi:two-component system sensor histidine kinase/response regulator
VVEDNEVNQKVAIGLLEQLGYTADIAGDGLVALDALDRRAYDAVLMDCQMPRMDGYQATTAIRRREGADHIPIIAMTASAMASDRDHCLAAGMDDHLAKPVRRDSLAAALSRWAGEAPVTALSAVTERPEGADDRVDEELLGELLELFPTGPANEPPPIVQTFLDETANRLERLHVALEAGDLEDAGRAAHSLKGASGTFGARRLQVLGGDAEAACARGDLQTVIDLVPVFASELDAFKAILWSRLSVPDDDAGTDTGPQRSFRESHAESPDGKLDEHLTRFAEIRHPRL